LGTIFEAIYSVKRVREAGLPVGNGGPTRQIEGTDPDRPYILKENWIFCENNRRGEKFTFFSKKVRFFKKNA
jgi:hypothetical protein